MKIEQLEYHDREYQWKLESVEFSSNINLLVGVTGAGKTQIIQSIKYLKRIARGVSLNGIKWNLVFSTKDRIQYQWKGEFESQPKLGQVLDNSENEMGFKILYESLTKNGYNILDRNEKEIIFQGQKTPKLSPIESAVHLFNQEEEIQPIIEAFQKIIFANLDPDDIKSIWAVPKWILRNYKINSLTELKQSNLPVSIKLSLMFRDFPDDFKKIKSTFTELFPNVEDIRIERINEDELDEMPLALIDIFKDSTQIKIKETKVESWIDQQHISSGMLKILMYISELYLCPDDSVILIDEFENSLGVNCLDSVTDLILDNPHLQFIITSHHPDIINNISPEYWKIVTRRGSVVTVKTAQDFHISKSRQKAFIDLINVLGDDDDSKNGSIIA